MVTQWSGIAMCISVLAFYVPTCSAPPVRQTPSPVAIESLWVSPTNIADRDLFYGPWGADHAPLPSDRYTLVGVKHHGVNPGVTVRDSAGRKWSVKQPLPDGFGDEGPVEVVVSRVLSAVGYRQPPVYYLPTFTLVDEWGARPEIGGRFRVTDKSLREIGIWSWQQNPFVGTRPYQGLLAILLLVNCSDLKNANNSLYSYRTGDLTERWFVVRDLGASLGMTGRLAPRRNDINAFERSRFIEGVSDGYVRFAYAGWHQELVRNRLTPDDVAWGAELLSRLSDEQWREAFRAGGYTDVVAARFIAKIHRNIAEARSLPVSITESAGR